MNKEELVELMAKQNPGLFRSKAAALRALDAVLNAVTTGVKRDRKRGVHLVNFGTFKVKSMRKRRGSDPRTAEPIIIPARKTVKFRCGKGLRDSVDRKPIPRAKPEEKTEKL
jgi:DNA-binding protein HU-beta